MVNNTAKRAALSIALVGIMAATLECGKLALSAIPNVEVVTLLCALYGYSFGALGILASRVFVCIEPIIWGVGPWIVSYLIYWPLVTFIFMIFGRIKIKNRIIITLTAVTLSAFFGILTSLVDLGLFSGNFDNFLSRFFIYYARGIYFYLAQIITNAVLFPVLFKPLTEAIGRIARKTVYK